MKRLIRLDFCDFWPFFDKHDNFFFNLLSERFDVRICDQPDFIIYCNNGHVHRLHNCVKIYFTHEPIRADFRECDWAFTAFYEDNPRHMRLPYYVVLHESPEPLIHRSERSDALLKQRAKFCSFVVSNQNPKRNRNRLEMFEKLSAYKRVDSGGRFMNNIGGPLVGYDGKIEWMRNYKFHISFENSCLPGYTTEKLCQALMARTLPLYWGNPRVAADFNPRSFLNASDFPDLDALVEKVVELDRDEAKYLEYLSEPAFPNNQPTEWYDRRRLLEQFERIFETTGPSVAAQRRRKRFVSLGRWILVKRHRVP
ncbi:MAG TPA: glycosyltransferase family 10 [Candidatus Binatia bacterium]|jgi:hypothetical protein|nr:glycosyltransferase family 10 [Candidatus Binatia bacterium]